MIAEKLLGLDNAAAAVAIDAAQIKGVLPLPLSSLRATLPVFKNPANKHRAVSFTADQFHYSFGNARQRRRIPAAVRAVGDPRPRQARSSRRPQRTSRHSPAAVATDNQYRGPLLLVMGGQDHTVPEAITKST